MRVARSRETQFAALVPASANCNSQDGSRFEQFRIKQKSDRGSLSAFQHSTKVGIYNVVLVLGVSTVSEGHQKAAGFDRGAGARPNGFRNAIVPIGDCDVAGAETRVDQCPGAIGSLGVDDARARLRTPHLAMSGISVHQIFILQVFPRHIAFVCVRRFRRFRRFRAAHFPFSALLVLFQVVGKNWFTLVMNHQNRPFLTCDFANIPFTVVPLDVDASLARPV